MAPSIPFISLAPKQALRKRSSPVCLLLPRGAGAALPSSAHAPLPRGPLQASLQASLHAATEVVANIYTSALLEEAIENGTLEHTVSNLEKLEKPRLFYPPPRRRCGCCYCDARSCRHRMRVWSDSVAVPSWQLPLSHRTLTTAWFARNRRGRPVRGDRAGGSLLWERVAGTAYVAKEMGRMRRCWRETEGRRQRRRADRKAGLLILRLPNPNDVRRGFGGRQRVGGGGVSRLHEHGVVFGRLRAGVGGVATSRAWCRLRRASLGCWGHRDFASKA